jgi:voltage-gated potassium channel Kch
LESAGTARAKYFVLAIDDVDASLKTARAVQEHFPNVTIMARARNRGHAYDLMDLGIADIKRETFDSGIYFVKDLLVKMGVAESRAVDIVERFKRHDETQLVEQFKVRSDDKMFVSIAKQSTAQLAQVLSDDNLQTRVKPKA